MNNIPIHNLITYRDFLEYVRPAKNHTGIIMYPNTIFYRGYPISYVNDTRKLAIRNTKIQNGKIGIYSFCSLASQYLKFYSSEEEEIIDTENENPGILLAYRPRWPLRMLKITPTTAYKFIQTAIELQDYDTICKYIAAFGYFGGEPNIHDILESNTLWKTDCGTVISKHLRHNFWRAIRELHFGRVSTFDIDTPLLGKLRWYYTDNNTKLGNYDGIISIVDPRKSAHGHEIFIFDPNTVLCSNIEIGNCTNPTNMFTKMSDLERIINIPGLNEVSVLRDIATRKGYLKRTHIDDKRRLKKRKT